MHDLRMDHQLSFQYKHFSEVSAWKVSHPEPFCIADMLCPLRWNGLHVLQDWSSLSFTLPATCPAGALRMAPAPSSRASELPQISRCCVCLQDGAPFSVKMKSLISVVAQLSPSPPSSPTPRDTKLAGNNGTI